MSDENINSITGSNYIITPELRHLNAKIKVKFSGSCLKQDKINTYTHGLIVNIDIVYTLFPSTNNLDTTLENGLFGAVKLTKTGHIYNYKYSRYGIQFDSKGIFFFSWWCIW